MTDKVELIRKEIERLKAKQLAIFSKGESEESCGDALTHIGAYNQLLSFVDSLSEEPVSEDLEEFALQYAGHYAPYNSCMQEVEDAVKAGAKWQEKKDLEIIETAIHHAYHNGRLEMKEQIMAKAIEGIARPDDDEIWCDLDSFNLKDDDKCRVIVIKENEL